ncbi:uncharacterized protein LOC144373648 isoform X2 [Ictidomys tridecemlineatus]
MESEGKTILPRIPGGLHFPHTFLLSTAGKKDGPNLGIQARGESAAHQCSLKPESNRSPETADKECCVECSSALEIHRYSRTQCPWFAGQSARRKTTAWSLHQRRHPSYWLPYHSDTHYSMPLLPCQPGTLRCSQTDSPHGHWMPLSLSCSWPPLTSAG